MRKEGKGRRVQDAEKEDSKYEYSLRRKVLKRGVLDRQDGRNEN